MRRRLKFPLLLLPLLVGALLLVALVLTMSRSEARLSGSNSVPTEGLVVQIGPHSRVCQQVLLPRDTASAQYFVAPLAAQGPPLSMRIDEVGRTLATSRIGGGWTGNTIRFHFPTVSDAHFDARICLRDEGRAPLRFIGLSTGTPTSTVVDGKPERAILSIVFFRPGKSDAWSLLPTIATRVGVLKGSLGGGWSLWFVVLLVVVAGASALLISVRGIPR